MTREQFIANVEATQRAFRRFLVALCSGDSQLADDIAQESYVKAYLSSDSLTQSEKFKTWMFRIGYTTFISEKRSAKSFADYDDARHVAADDRADDAFRYQALYAALDHLSQAERTSVLLFYMENYSIKEIAEIEGVSEAAVKQHLSRGRQHLRSLLNN